MSSDITQDVFPILFDFVKGETPTATKFTGFVQITDAAFSNLGSIIGDPWDIQSHTDAGSAQYFLSPDRLSQASLARFSGPSDYVGPRGASFQESTTTIFTLETYRNRWCLGFPLIKLSSDLDISDSGSGVVQPIDWDTDVTVNSDPEGLLNTKVDTAEEVDTAGYFHVDFYKGIITTYERSLSPIVFTVAGLHTLGPGVPWGTSNVIPHWTQTSSLCTLTEDSTAGGITTYLLEFPTVIDASRKTSTTQVKGGTHTFGETADSGFYSDRAPGVGAYYRLPNSMTANLTDGHTIPTGFMRLWDETQSRMCVVTAFQYKNANEVWVLAPEDSLTVGERYRLIVTGTSLAEAVHYNMVVSRDNRHAGLANDQCMDTLFYTQPIDHDDLAGLHGGSIPSSISTVDAELYYFTKSNYPTNPHPQYLHRAGYMEDDLDGNSGNAMRGDLVFTGVAPNYEMGTGPSDGTYGILFGGGSRSVYGNVARIAYEGGEDIDDWESDTAVRFGFHYSGVGTGAGYHGALTYTPWYGTPLYLRGRYHAEAADQLERGAVLAFDMSRRSEMNYIKLLPANRSGTYDVANIPANIDNGQFGTPLECTQRGLSNRLAVSQIREFRFRGVPYVDDAINTSDSIGAGSVNEFNQYFTSPGVVGADFFNVYSNAIFFSVNPDGQRTSFTETGAGWMGDSSADPPVGIYYEPNASDTNGQFVFWTQGDDGNRYETFKFSRNDPTILTTRDTISLFATDNDASIFIIAGQSANTTSDINMTAYADINIEAWRDVNISSYGDDITIGTTSGTNFAKIEFANVASTPYVQLTADTDDGASANRIRCSSSSVSMTSNGAASITTGTDIALQAGTQATVDASTYIEMNADTYIKLSSSTEIKLDSSDGEYYMMDVPTKGGADVLMYIDVLGTDIGRIRRETSSRKYKTNIRDLEDICWMYDLTPRSYSLKANMARTEYGLIAEEAQEVCPNLVVANADGEPEAVSYIQLISVLIKAAQNQKEEIEWLKAELDKKSNKRVTKKKKKQK